MLMGFLGCNPAPPTSLEAEVQAVIDLHPGATVAVALRDRLTSTNIDIQSDQVFHAASTMKVPVMIEAWRWVQEGWLAMDQLLTCTEFL